MNEISDFYQMDRSDLCLSLSIAYYQLQDVFQMN